MGAGRQILLSVWILGFGLFLFLHSQSQTQVGYTVLTADAGMKIPVATALFTYTNASGVMVSQAGVGAVDPISSGRIFVDQNGAETGFALVNATSQMASITLTLRTQSGGEAGKRTLTLEGGKHTARFVSEFFKELAAGFTGSLTLESTQKMVAITLRQTTNGRGEPLYTTLPVLDLSKGSTATPVIFPQIAAGEGYTTQVILMNPTSQTERGTVSLVGSDGAPLTLSAGTSQGSQFSYEIAGQGTYRIELEKAGAVKSGYAVVTPEGGSTTPSGSAVFRYKVNGKAVTEAGVEATRPTTSARIFVDNADTMTGVALANTENQGAAVSLTLLDKNGVRQQTVVRNLAAKGHLAVFVNELFPELDNKFNGLMEITSTTPVSAITLKMTVNGRNDLVYTTLPVADLNNAPTSSQMVFPQIAFGGGFTTRLIFINIDQAKIATGRLSFYRSDSTAMPVAFGSQTATQFPYQLAMGGGTQFFPGNTARIASIAIIDPQTNQITKEIAVNEGNTVKASLLVLDESGMPRDDFALSYTSLDPTIATVDGYGFITGKKAGFSTLTISSGGVIVTGTINVVSVRVGMGGYKVTGIVQDMARRLYLAATDDNAILLAEDLGKAAQVYAGVRGVAGLRNDTRLNSLFKRPGFLAFDQAKGTMYVSDGENNVIRRVQPGPDGKVETYAGTGERGSADGQSAKFNNPQGVVLDNRGYLWVVDSGNHTVRRVNLTTGVTETVAGKAGVSGWADGKGAETRFSSPMGIALETESPVIGFLNATPRPVSVVIADTGNGVIRRVKETGEAETIGGAEAGNAQAPAKGMQAESAPATFKNPTGVAVDPFGNIYVSEAEAGRVRMILESGQIVSAAQGGTFVSPRGMAAAEGGRIVVADSRSYAQQVLFGLPQITSITPDNVGVRGGEKVTIRGKNFSPESMVIVGPEVIRSATIRDCQTIEFIAPANLPNGYGTLTVQNRGGLAQSRLLIIPIPTNALPQGYITTFAGGSTYAGDGDFAISAAVNAAGCALDHEGNLFIADEENNRVRKVASSTGIITTVAGNGALGFSGDSAAAVSASFKKPHAVDVDAAGNVFIADQFNGRVRKLDRATGNISTIAGNGGGGFSGDGGRATGASLSAPKGIAVDSAGNIFIADSDNHRIRKVAFSTGIITTVAGNGAAGFSGDGGPATEASLSWPFGVALDSAGNLFIADRNNHRVRKIDFATGIITTVAGNGQEWFSGDGIPASTASLHFPEQVAVDSTGNLFIADTENNRVRKVSASTGIITTVAGNGRVEFSGDGGPAITAATVRPTGIALDSGGNLYIASYTENRIRKVSSPNGSISTFAGDGRAGFSGDGAPSIAASLYDPKGVTLDSSNNVLIAEAGAARIRRIAASDGMITTVAGNGSMAFSGDGGPATAASIEHPLGVAVDSAGNIFIAPDGFRVRKVAAATGIITTVAGHASLGFSGDGGPATAASLFFPSGVALDSGGNLLIADKYNQRIRKVAIATGVITTVAGNGAAGFSGDGGPAATASLNYPERIAIGPAGDLFISDTSNHRIRKVAATTGTITTVAGNNRSGFSGDGGVATSATLYFPSGIALDAAGNLFIADSYNHRIRKVSAATGVITTIAGNGIYAFSGDGGPAADASFRYPYDVAMDSRGNLYIADSYNGRIRFVHGPFP